MHEQMDEWKVGRIFVESRMSEKATLHREFLQELNFNLQTEDKGMKKEQEKEEKQRQWEAEQDRKEEELFLKILAVATNMAKK